MENKDKLKLTVAFLAAAYFTYAWLTPGNWRFLDYVNLAVHEAGHLFLSPFGETMGVLGGTVFQLAFPLLFTLYFAYHGQKYSAGIVLFWLSESLNNVSVYASDALTQNLPLLGGEGSIHDWNWILFNFGMLRQAKGVGETIHLLSLAVLCGAVLMSFRYSLSGKSQKTGDPGRIA